MNGHNWDSADSGESSPPETPEAPGAGARIAIEAAQDVVRRSRCELQPPARTRSADTRSRQSRLIKARQSLDLWAWAKERSCLLSETAFNDRWLSQGGVGGQECEVYYEPGSGCYIKRNHTVAYADWVQFFESVRIHNALFVDTAYDLLGFMVVDDHLCAVLSQTAVPSTRGASRSEVENQMAEYGFRHVGFDHYESESLLIQDLHSENVLVGPGDHLYFIDTCIYLKDGKVFPLD